MPDLQSVSFKRISTVGRKDMTIMRAKLLLSAAFVASWLVLTVPASAAEWRSMTLCCKVIKGGYDVWGGDTAYSLMVRFQNAPGHQPVTIRMHELYNAVLNISLENSETGQVVGIKPGRTGDVIPKDVKDQDEAIVVGPGATATITIGLDGFREFRPGEIQGSSQVLQYRDSRIQDRGQAER